MKHITTFVAIAAFFTCGFAYSEDEPGPNYDHLKPLESVMGQWVATSVLTEDAPGVGKKGDTIHYSVTYKRGLNKNIVQCTFVYGVKERQMHELQGTIGWDAGKQKLVAYAFSTAGWYWLGDAAIDNEKTHRAMFHVAYPDGRVGKETIVVTRIDDDTITWQTTEITVEGEKQPDRPMLELKQK